MNILPTTYSNYQTGFTFNPLSDTSRNKDGMDTQNPLGINPAVNPPAKQTGAPQNAPPPPSEAGQNQEKTANPDTDATQEKAKAGETQSADGRVLEANELRLVEALKKADTEVRAHEMAHVAAGGRYITSGANFSYKRGPDGKNYAVGGEVSIDTAPVPGDPEATLRKMRQVKSSALAPASPSAQDLKVASKATSAVSKALSDLMMLQAKERASQNEEQAFGDMKKVADSYEKVDRLPEGETSSFEIAV